MCELCGPRITRRTALALAGGAAVLPLIGWRDQHASAATLPSELEIQPRASWAGDSRPATGPLEAEDVRFLLVHHSATPVGAEPIGVMRSVYDFHTGPEKEWPDVAYNFFIDHNGVVYEARSGSLDGPIVASATGGSQGFAQLVCLLGDFTGELPTDAALTALDLTLAWLADRDDVDSSPGATASFTSRGSNLWPEGDAVTADTISGHREMSSTACPGDTFYPYLKTDVPARVERLRSPEENPTSTTRVPPATRPTAPSSTTSTTSTTTTTTTEPPPTTLRPSPTTSPSSVPADDPASGSGSSSTDVNVPLAVAGGTAVLGGVAALVAGLRRRDTDDVTDDGGDEGTDGTADGTDSIGDGGGPGDT